MTVRTVVATGDISDGWEIVVRNLDKSKMELTFFTCKAAVIAENDEVVFQKDVPLTDGVTDSFLVWLTDTETAQLDPDTAYRLVVQVENPAQQPKPIKKEVTEAFKTKKGFID